jgi:hypothetical protein
MSATLPLTPVVEANLVPQDGTPRNDLAAALHALAFNPDVPVEKLEKIIELHERVQANAAKAEFDEAFAAMQHAMPVIVERKQTNNGRYAPLEDIVEQVRPILAKYGFSLSHRTEWPDKSIVKVIGILAHKAGHERTSEFISSADSSGNKNAIQGLGSAISYGRRYTTNDLLNVVTRDMDDDARRAEAPSMPDGYPDWLETLTEKSREGLPALTAMFNTANADKTLKPYAAYLLKHDTSLWARLKDAASKVRRSGGAK